MMVMTVPPVFILMMLATSLVIWQRSKKWGFSLDASGVVTTINALTDIPPLTDVGQAALRLWKFMTVSIRWGDRIVADVGGLRFSARGEDLEPSAF